MTEPKVRVLAWLSGGAALLIAVIATLLFRPRIPVDVGAGATGRYR